MTPKFVRYSPEVEQTEPDFEQTLQTVLDDMKQHMRGSVKTEGIGLMVRNAHAAAFTIPKQPVRRRVRGIETFNVLRGDEYFFRSSLSALKWLAHLDN